MTEEECLFQENHYEWSFKTSFAPLVNDTWSFKQCPPTWAFTSLKLYPIGKQPLDLEKSWVCIQSFPIGCDQVLRIQDGPNSLPRELWLGTKDGVGLVPGVQISIVGCKCVPLPNGMLMFSDPPSIHNTGHNSLKFHSAFLWMFGIWSAESQNSCIRFKENLQSTGFSFWSGLLWSLAEWLGNRF